MTCTFGILVVRAVATICHATESAVCGTPAGAFGF
jgi:hypothetical protein